MRIPCLVLTALIAFPRPARSQRSGLESAVHARLAAEPAEVSVAYVDLVTGDTLFVEADRRFHAASTMKIPVLVELARRVDSGEIGWASPVTVRNAFRSIVDGSGYVLDEGDDSDSTLYALEGRDTTIEVLAERMIARSSNLATNLLIARLDPVRVNRTARMLGADSVAVLRGVEDGKAYERGLNNTTTARDLARLLSAIADGRAASPAATRRMLDFLFAQEFNDGIPAGLPAGARVAHKTGWISGIAHDAALVYPPDRGPFVLVVLTRGYAEEADAQAVMADLAGAVYRWAVRGPGPHE